MCKSVKCFELEALLAIQKSLVGLPSFTRNVIQTVALHADFIKGEIVLNKTLNQLANEIFYVERAPGRKSEKITPETIRNAFRTIKKFRGEDFKFRTEDQRIVIEMPFIREMYADHVKQQELTAVNTGEDHGYNKQGFTGLKDDFTIKVPGENTGEVTAVNSPINSINNNKLNKQTKTLISRDFYPSQETIKIAEERGLVKVTDEEELKKFITYNLANQTQWVDFNPVFITWLEREAEHRKQQELQQQTESVAVENQQDTGRAGHASRATTPNKKQSSWDDVAEALAINKIKCRAPSDSSFAYDECPKSEFDARAYLLAMDEICGTVHEPVCQQIR